MSDQSNESVHQSPEHLNPVQQRLQVLHMAEVNVHTLENAIYQERQVPVSNEVIHYAAQAANLAAAYPNVDRILEDVAEIHRQTEER